MTRPRGYVSPEVVYKVAEYCKSIGQKYIALHNMGEPLLHPRLTDIITIFKNHNIETEFSTNGILLDTIGNNVLAAKPNLIRIAVDYFYERPGYIDAVNAFLHKANNTSTAVRLHTIVGNNLGVFITGTNILHEVKPRDNWASQSRFESCLPDSDHCYFLDCEYCVVLWNGDIVQCCNDFDAKYPIGHINTIQDIKVRNIPLCNDCKKLQFAVGGKWEL